MLALVAGITSFAQNATAALVTINIGPSPGFDIGGINAGLSNGGSVLKFAFPIYGGYNSANLLILENNYNGNGTGLQGDIGLSFAAGIAPATPVKFGPNASIGSGSSYVSGNNSNFKKDSTISPDFGPGSYMGFKTIQGNYGWLEVTWTASSSQFQILSGAYESVAGVGIRAGAGAAPIPEPGTWAAMAIFAGGAAFAGWRRRKSAKIAA
jgi:hypothetical protein